MKRYGILEDENTPRFKYCSKCHKPMPRSITDDVCPECAKKDLYEEVKDFIEHNDVTEFEVATRFGIEIAQVRQWIDEGLFEYRKGPNPF